jgi:hypothetical protein
MNSEDFLLQKAGYGSNIGRHMVEECSALFKITLQ